MLGHDSVAKRASALLVAKGLKPDLSEQAKAVTQAIIEAVNDELDGFVLVRQGSQRRMRKPTLEQVKLHATKIGLPESEAHKFFDFYESKGWKVGDQPMKLWTAAMSNWKRGWQEEHNKRNGDGKLSPNVETVKNQKALDRVEERLKVIRGQFPLPANDPKRLEFDALKTEQSRLKQSLGFKA